MDKFEKALSSTVGSGGDVIVPQLADQIIPFIRQKSYLRQFLVSFNQPTETYNMGADGSTLSDKSLLQSHCFGETPIVETNQTLRSIVHRIEERLSQEINKGMVYA